MAVTFVLKINNKILYVHQNEFKPQVKGSQLISALSFHNIVATTNSDSLLIFEVSNRARKPYRRITRHVFLYESVIIGALLVLFAGIIMG